MSRIVKLKRLNDTFWFANCEIYSDIWLADSGRKIEISTSLNCDPTLRKGSSGIKKIRKMKNGINPNKVTKVRAADSL